MNNHPSTEDLASFIDGECPNVEEIEQHLDQCPNCLAIVAMSRHTLLLDKAGLLTPLMDEERNSLPAGIYESPASSRLPRPLSYTTIAASKNRATAVIAAAVAASLMIGMICGLAWSRLARSKPFEVLVAQASVQPVTARGAREDERSITIQSQRSGFAAIIAMSPDQRPLVLPSDVPVSAGERAVSVPLPAGLKNATLVLVVVTEQPASWVIEQVLDSATFKQGQANQLRSLIIETLTRKNYHWVAIGTSVPPPDQSP
jgi:anti-sigma factor RsiW